MRRAAFIATLLAASCLPGGDSNISGRLIVEDAPGSPPTCATATGAGDICAEDAIEANGAIDVGGAATLTGAVTASSTLDVSGALAADGGLSVDSPAFDVTDATGAISTASTLTINAAGGSTNGTIISGSGNVAIMADAVELADHFKDLTAATPTTFCHHGHWH